MSYEPNVALARKLSKALRTLGLSVKRSLNESMLTVADEETHGVIIIECRKNDTAGYDVSMWAIARTLHAAPDVKASKALVRTLAAAMRDVYGLRPDVAR